MDKNCKLPRKQREGAFTLIEMLVVVAIIGILLAVAVPSFFGAIGASRLTQAGDQLLGQLSEAQETAISAGRPVEVRLYKMPDANDPVGGVGQYRGVLILEYFHPGQDDPRVDLDPAYAGVRLTAPLALARQPLSILPGGVVMTEVADMSSLIATTAGTTPTASSSVQTFVKMGTTYKSYTVETGETYRSFIFYPESTSLSTTGKWFVTLVDSKDITAAAADVANFYTIQVDPSVGRLSVYRP